MIRDAKDPVLMLALGCIGLFFVELVICLIAMS